MRSYRRPLFKQSVRIPKQAFATFETQAEMATAPSTTMSLVDRKDTTFLKKLEKVVNRDYMKLQQEPEPVSLITTDTSMPMKRKKQMHHGSKFDCPDNNCTVCKTFF